MFSKKDLKTGMIVVFSDGGKGMVLLDTDRGNIVSGDKYFHLDGLSSDLKYCQILEYEIIEVWQPRYNYYYLNEWSKPNLSEFNYEKIWERHVESPEQVKKRELVEKYEAVKKELEELGKQIGEV